MKDGLSDDGNYLHRRVISGTRSAALTGRWSLCSSATAGYSSGLIKDPLFMPETRD